MGRRGPKFSFPIPGRKSHTKAEKGDKAHDSTGLVPSMPSVPEWSPRYDDPSSYSKAERLLGTSGLPFRPSSRQTSVPPSPGYMTITVSEASFESDHSDRASSTAVKDGSLLPVKRPGMSHRPSSNILGSAYKGDGRQASNCSSISRRLNPRTSNSTMRSHYDAQTSPLYISQQTSDSAVRDMALRKGQPPITPTSAKDNDSHVLGPLSRQLSDETKKQNRKSKPARLDLSKLFPKPKANGGQQSAGTLLSPNKLVNSPSAMSTASEYFPRPMTREPTPTLRGNGKLTKAPKRQQAPPPSQSLPSTSPVRLHKPDVYDSAKINIRRPPRGIQHWFEGFGEESDNSNEGEPAPAHARRPFNPNGAHLVPNRKSSLGSLLQDARRPQQQRLRPQQSGPLSRTEQHVYAPPFRAHHVNSPSQFSMQSQSSLVSTRTKESNFSKSNLQDSSVLSISSSEEESEDDVPAASKFPVHNSIDTIEDHGDSIIDKTQTFEMPPRLSRRRISEGKLSMLSTSTNAATIEVMYTPEPYTPQHFSRGYSSKRSSHTRQPSVIHEDEGIRPNTSVNRPMSPSSNSTRSAQTSMSEPMHKLMAVTAEEEALLEMMRRKRVAMAKHSFTEGYKTAIKQEETRQKTPPDTKRYRTSGFLSIDSPSASPARKATVSSSRKSFANTASPLLLAPPRGRPIKFAQDSSGGTSVLRDSSSCDTGSDRHPSPSTHASLAHHLSPPPEFSPFDPFPSSTPTASVASLTTTDHRSSFPSPVTPGLRNGEADVHVKVAGSEPSCNGDNDDVAILETGVIEPPFGSIKTNESRSSQGTVGAYHQRRRTASSGADVSCNPVSQFPVPPKSHDLAPVSEPGPKPPRTSSHRVSTLTVTTTASSRNRHSSIVSSRTSSPSNISDRRSSKMGSVSRGNSISSTNSIKRDSVVVGSASTRCSVSEDVLAAWGSLGGWRDVGDRT